MDVTQILRELHAERDRLDKAIAALAGFSSSSRTTERTTTTSTTTNVANRGRRRLSPAARKRLSQLLKQRWASGKMGRRRKAKAA